MKAMSDKYRYEIEDRPCEPHCANEDAEGWCDIADWEGSRADYYKQQLKETQEQLEALKADKAKVEVETLRKYSNYVYEDCLEVTEAIHHPVISIFRAKLDSYASQLETKEQKEL